MFSSMFLLIIILALAAFASAEDDQSIAAVNQRFRARNQARDLRFKLNCAPHAKMSEDECTRCINHGYKLKWLGTKGYGRGGCQYVVKPDPFISQCLSAFNTKPNACNPTADNLDCGSGIPDPAQCDGVTDCDGTACAALSNDFTNGRSSLAACRCWAACVPIPVFRSSCPASG